MGHGVALLAGVVMAVGVCLGAEDVELRVNGGVGVPVAVAGGVVAVGDGDADGVCVGDSVGVFVGEGVAVSVGRLVQVKRETGPAMAVAMAEVRGCSEVPGWLSSLSSHTNTPPRPAARAYRTLLARL